MCRLQPGGVQHEPFPHRQDLDWQMTEEVEAFVRPLFSRYLDHPVINLAQIDHVDDDPQVPALRSL
jgi:hypothetical protein